MNISIAIDGPSGAGKSTIAKKIASMFGIIYVDTGAIYRTIGYAAQVKDIDTTDEAAVNALLPQVQIDMAYGEDGAQKMLLWGEDVSREIRTPKSSICASNVSKLPEVRAFLLDMQRDMAKKQSVIMDGRDIGTVVLPDADLKIYLTASAEERARRRCLELEEKGMPSTFEEVLKDMQFRDHQDMTRPVAPLKQADDAILVDTTELDFDQSVEKIASIIRERFSL